MRNQQSKILYFLIKYVKEALEGTREQALCYLFTTPPQIHNHATGGGKNNLTIFFQFNIAVYGTQRIWSQSVLIWNMFRNGLQVFKSGLDRIK